MFLLVFGLNLDAGGGHTTLPDFFRRERPARHLERLQFRAQILDRAAGIDQGTEDHVAADSAKAIKIREFHNGRPPSDGTRTARKVVGKPNDSIGGARACQTMRPPGKRAGGKLTKALLPWRVYTRDCVSD